jgi:L-lactate dehydrogenase complex protein LldF
MTAAGEVLSRPKLYRITTSATETALKLLPRFAIYNDLNAWGKHRETPAPAKQTFHQWYKHNRQKT